MKAIMEMTTEHHILSLDKKHKLERKDSLEVESKKSYRRAVQEERDAKSSGREVMVESISSTTEHRPPCINPERQREPEMWQSKEALKVTTSARIIPKIASHYRVLHNEDSKRKSHESREHYFSGREKRFRREHCGSESTSKRHVAALQGSPSTSRHSEREAKVVEPEVSSSSLVLVPRRPAPPRVSSYSSNDNRRANSFAHRHRDRTSRPHSGNTNTLKKYDAMPPRNFENKERHFKDKDRPRKWKNERHDTLPHDTDEPTNFEKMVEINIRQIRENLERMSQEIQETMEEPTPRSAESAERCEDNNSSWDNRRVEESQLTPFLPSSRCCSPPPRPMEITKYWSDADETEDESDPEKHWMHVNSVNTVLNYLKANKDVYHKKGEMNHNHKLRDEKVEFKGSIQERLIALSHADSPNKKHEGRHGEKQHNFGRGSHLTNVTGLNASLKDEQSRFPSGDKDQYEEGRLPRPFPEQREGYEEQYEEGRLPYPFPEEREGYHRLHSPPVSQEAETLRHRGSHSPLRHEGKRRHLPAACGNEEFHSPWHKRRSLVRESCSPLRQRNSPLNNRKSRSPPRHRSNYKRHRGSHSPPMYRESLLMNRGPYVPHRYRCESSSRYIDDCVRRRRSPSYYSDDSLRDRQPQSHSYYKGNPLRDRQLQEQGGSLLEEEVLSQRRKEYSTMPERSPLPRSPEYHPTHVKVHESRFIHEKNPRRREPFQSPSHVSSSYSNSRRHRSRSSEVDVSSRLHMAEQETRDKPTPEINQRAAGWERTLPHSSQNRKQKKSIHENSKYFFNPEVNSEEDEQEGSESYIESYCTHKGEEHFISHSSLSSDARSGSNNIAYEAKAAHDSVSDLVRPIHAMKFHGCEENKQGNISMTMTKTITLDDYNLVNNHPKDYLNEDAAATSTCHQLSFVPCIQDRKMMAGIEKPSKTWPKSTQDNLPGPSVVSSHEDVDDIPSWPSDSDDDLNTCLSEVTSLIADHQAVTANKTEPNAALTEIVPKESVDTKTCRQNEEGCLTLNSEEMDTLISLIEVARKHTASGDDLSSNLPKILEKIRQTTTTTTTSESPNNQSEGSKERPNTAQLNGGKQDNRMHTISSSNTTSTDTIKNSIKSNNKQKVDKSIAAPKKMKKQLPQGSISKSNVLKNMSDAKGLCKPQESKSKQGKKANDKSPKKMSEAKNKSKQHEGKGKDTPTGEKTKVQSSKKVSDVQLLQKDKDKEESLKNKGDMEVTKTKQKPVSSHQGKGGTKGNKSSAIEQTFANMQLIKIYVGDTPASKTKVAESSGKAKNKARPPIKDGDREAVADGSPQDTHSLHRETIILDHSVSICLACKHELVPDTYTCISLSTGIVTMRCKVCQTFTKMATTVPLTSNTKTSKAPQKVSMSKPKSKKKEKSKAERASDASKQTTKKSPSHRRTQKTANKKKTATQTSTERVKQVKAGGDKLVSPNPSASKAAHVKVPREENKSTGAPTSQDKGSISCEERQGSPSPFDTIDAALCVFPWTSSRQKKKIHENLNLDDNSSDSDEEYMLKTPKRKPTKRKRIIHSPSNSDNDE